MKKHAVLCIAVVLTVSSLISVSFASTSIAIPSVPEFALRLFDSSYDIPATVSTDIYNGQQITTPSRHLDQRTIEIIIKNTPFTPFQLKDARGNTIEAVFCYHIRWKAHFAPEKDWETLFGPYYQYLPRGPAAETVRQINITHIYDGSFDVPEWSRHMPADTQLDFQVQAMIGGPNNVWDFSGETSNWSPTQTITFSSSTPLPNDSLPTSMLAPSKQTEPAKNETSQTIPLAIIGVGIPLVLVGVGLLVYSKKRMTFKVGK